MGKKGCFFFIQDVYCSGKLFLFIVLQLFDLFIRCILKEEFCRLIIIIVCNYYTMLLESLWKLF